MAIQFKLKCIKCKKNYQLATRRDKWVICYECHKPMMQGKVKDSKIEKMFDIPEEYYKRSMFLRDIKIKAIQYDELSEKQIEAFKKTVEKMKELIAQEEKDSQ